jgi:hypothetical protein
MNKVFFILKHFFLIVVLCGQHLFSQDDYQKFYKSIRLEFRASDKNEYTYHREDGRIRERSVGNSAIQEAAYHLDYALSRQFLIGAHTGFTYFGKLKASSLKIGGGLSLIYTDDALNFLTVQYGYQIPFQRADFREGHQIKLGQYFDVSTLFGKKLTIGVLYIYDYLDRQGSKPILFPTNIPSHLIYRSYGISFGLTF